VVVIVIIGEVVAVSTSVTLRMVLRIVDAKSFTVVDVVTDAVSVAEMVFTVEVLRLVTVLVMVTGEAAKEHADVMTQAGYLLSTVGPLTSRRLKATIDVVVPVCVMVTVVVVGTFNVKVEAVVV
jgi:hypothetical protein